jgi:hypothetical protein
MYVIKEVCTKRSQQSQQYFSMKLKLLLNFKQLTKTENSG